MDLVFGENFTSFVLNMEDDDVVPPEKFKEVNFASENPPYMQVFSFEKLDWVEWTQWMRHWWVISIYASVLYVALIYLGKRYMKHRSPYDLRKQLVVWNFTMAFSELLMLSRAGPELHYLMEHEGFYDSFCSLKHNNIATHFWGYLFVFNKLIQFGDTFFIIARKRPVLFLHWYHHMTVAIYSFYAASVYDPAGRWFGYVNAIEHILMYSYFGFKAMQVKIPRKIAMAITLSQLLQMVLGIVINVVSLYAKLSGTECSRPSRNIYLAFAIYVSYFVLFGLFFRQAYLHKDPITSHPRQQNKSESQSDSVHAPVSSVHRIKCD